MSDGAPWRLARRVGFRFAFAYWALYFPLLPIDRLPRTAPLIEAWTAAWAPVALFFARHFLGRTTPFRDASDGLMDASFGHARFACVVALAAVAASVWSLVDERRARTSYARLEAWLRTWLRYGLAGALIHYGVSKVINVQFAPPALDKLLERIGDQSQMGMFWTFMGHSQGYARFGGALECVAGALLVSRRTTSLGALVAVGVLGNVVALDLGYDVPVRLFAANLVAMAAYLAAPDVARVLALLVMRRRVAPPPVPPPLLGARWAPAASLASLVWLALLILVAVREDLARDARVSPLPALYGVYEVDELTRDGVDAPPLTTDARRWRFVTIDRARFGDWPVRFSVWSTSGSRDGRGAREEGDAGVLRVEEGESTVDLDVERLDDDHLVIRGPWRGASVVAHAHRVPLRSFPVTTPFRWVIERLDIR